MAGWLKIESTTIDYPVMQRPGPEDYYLSHDFLGGESKNGFLFIDGSASLQPEDDNVVVNGHNMRNGDLFGALLFYRDYNYFRFNPVFQFDTLYEKRSYQIVAAFVVDTSETDDFCYYECRDLSDEELFDQCRDYLKENQLYDTGSSLAYGDKLVMLSTCESTSRDHRFVVVGKRIQES